MQMPRSIASCSWWAMHHLRFLLLITAAMAVMCETSAVRARTVGMRRLRCKCNHRANTLAIMNASGLSCAACPSTVLLRDSTQWPQPWLGAYKSTQCIVVSVLNRSHGLEGFTSPCWSHTKHSPHTWGALLSLQKQDPVTTSALKMHACVPVLVCEPRPRHRLQCCTPVCRIWPTGNVYPHLERRFRAPGLDRGYVPRHRLRCCKTDCKIWCTGNMSPLPLLGWQVDASGLVEGSEPCCRLRYCNAACRNWPNDSAPSSRGQIEAPGSDRGFVPRHRLHCCTTVCRFQSSDGGQIEAPGSDGGLVPHHGMRYYTANFRLWFDDIGLSLLSGQMEAPGSDRGFVPRHRLLPCSWVSLGLGRKGFAYPLPLVNAGPLVQPLCSMVLQSVNLLACCSPGGLPGLCRRRCSLATIVDQAASHNLLEYLISVSLLPKSPHFFHVILDFALELMGHSKAAKRRQGNRLGKGNDADQDAAAANEHAVAAREPSVSDALDTHATTASSAPPVGLPLQHVGNRMDLDPALDDGEDLGSLRFSNEASSSSQGLDRGQPSPSVGSLNVDRSEEPANVQPTLLCVSSSSSDELQLPGDRKRRRKRPPSPPRSRPSADLVHTDAELVPDDAGDPYAGYADQGPGESRVAYLRRCLREALVSSTHPSSDWAKQLYGKTCACLLQLWQPYCIVLVLLRMRWLLHRLLTMLCGLLSKPHFMWITTKVCPGIYVRRRWPRPRPACQANQPCLQKWSREQGRLLSPLHY